MSGWKGKRPKRQKLSAGSIIRAWESSGGKCHWCLRPVAPERVVVDHLLPVALSGTNAQENLVVACAPCNLAKSDTHPRIWELHVHHGMPRCAATEIHQLEQDPAYHGSDDVLFFGALYEELPSGKRRLVSGPLGIAQCRKKRCPDCH